MPISGSLKPHGLCNMGFFDAFQQWAGENRAKRLRPIEQMKNEVQLELERRQAIAKQLHEQSFRDIAAELEKQRARAESVAQNPDQLLSVTEHVPSWNEADELALHDAYQRSGIDRKKQAEADQAVLAADAFKRGLATITNKAALVNIGMGKEYKPVELEGGVFYNPYDTQNFNLGSTEKHQAETKLEQSEAAEQALRLARIQALQDPLMQINATSNKEVGKPVEVIIEGENGESNIVLASQDSSGKYRPQVLADTATGKPLVIPPEEVGGDELREIRLARALKEHGVVESEAEGLELVVYGKTKSDDTFLESRLIANAQGPHGSRNSDKKILTATFDDFVRARYGSLFPGHFIDEINRSTTMKPAEKKALIAQIENYNDKMVNEGLAGKQPPPPPVVNQTVTGTGQPETAITNRAPATQKPLWNLDNIQFQQQPGLQLPDMPPPDMALAPMAQPAAPATIPEQPEIPDFQVITETILNNNGPAEINAALKKQGFDVSPENMSAMAIDAVNRGENPVEIQQLLQFLGIQWTPPA